MAKTAVMKVWDVELGLAIHIKAPNSKYIVIDLGSKKDVSPLEALEGKNVGYMIITHPHHDHFSDIKNVEFAYPELLWRVKAYSHKELLDGVREEEKEDFVKYCDFTDSFNGTIEDKNLPSTGNPFDGLSVNVFSTSKCDKINKNNFSGIAVLKLGNAKVIVCGDNEKDSFDILMKDESFKTAVKNAYVLVAPHHGRDSGYNLDFLNLVNPYITIISDTGKGETSVTEKYEAKTIGWNVYNHLTKKTENRKCLTTRNDGNIEIIFGEPNDWKHPGSLSAAIHCD